MGLKFYNTYTYFLYHAEGSVYVEGLLLYTGLTGNNEADGVITQLGMGDGKALAEGFVFAAVKIKLVALGVFDFNGEAFAGGVGILNFKHQLVIGSADVLHFCTRRGKCCLGVYYSTCCGDEEGGEGELQNGVTQVRGTGCHLLFHVVCFLGFIPFTNNR